MTEFDIAFKELSERYNHAARDGDIPACTDCLVNMAEITDMEKRPIDSLKYRMIAFYFALSGVKKAPELKKDLVTRIGKDAVALGLSQYEIDEEFLKYAIEGSTPSHTMHVRDVLYLMDLCLDDRAEEAEEIVNKI